MSCASRPHLSCWFLEHFFKQTNLRVSEACNWLTAAAGPCGKQWNNKLYAATHMPCCTMKRESDLRRKKWNWLFSRYEEMEGCGLNTVSSVIDTIGFLSDSHWSFFCLSESLCLLCSTYSLHSSRPERSGLCNGVPFLVLPSYVH